MSRILRAKQAMAKLGIKKSKFHDDIKKGLLPKPVSLGGRAVGYVEDEIDAHIDGLKSDRDRGHGNGKMPKRPPDPSDDNDEDDDSPQ